MTSWGEREAAGVWERDPAPGARPSGAVFGYIYETIERGQRDDECRYIGKTETTIHRRVHGPTGHTSPRSVAKDPWKANILPGKHGYRCLEIVRDTGEGLQANKRALARAESDWIDRRRPLRNQVRPVRPRHGEPPARPTPRSTRTRQPSGRKVALVLLVAALAFLFELPLSGAGLPWWMQWVVAPALAATLGWYLFCAAVGRIDRARRKIRRVLH